MDRDINQFVPEKGMDVIGSDDEKIGEVDAVEQDYFVVRKGFFFPEDHYIPVSAISTYDDNRIYLTYTRDQVLEQDWVAPPTTDATLTGTDVDYRDSDLNQVDTTSRPGTAPDLDIDRDTLVDRDVTTRDDEITIPLHEEELIARRRKVERGEVGINKRVVEHEESIDVPITEERVDITRRAVDRDVAPGEEVFQEATIEVPVEGEEVVVEKRAQVTEEVEVGKIVEQHTERVTDTVRHEEVDIEGEEVYTDADLDRPR